MPDICGIGLTKGNVSTRNSMPDICGIGPTKGNVSTRNGMPDICGIGPTKGNVSTRNGDSVVQGGIGRTQCNVSTCATRRADR
jgi:hypothetical protein